MALVFRGGWVNISGPETGVEDEMTEFEDISQSFIAAEDIPTGRVVIVNSAGTIEKATVSSTNPIIGIVASAVSEGGSGSVVTFGTHTFAGWNFLEPGKSVYLTGDGELTQTMPTSGAVCKMGIALSSTSIHIRTFITTALSS